jgi:hypothetical protein
VTFPNDYWGGGRSLSQVVKLYERQAVSGNLDGEDYWAIVNGQLVLYGWRDIDFGGTSEYELFDPPLAILRPDQAPGQIVSSSSALKTYPNLSATTTPTEVGRIEYSSSLIGFESVTVPAGTFSNCLHLHLRFTLYNSSGFIDENGDIDIWFAQDIGAIKWLFSFPGENEESVLVKYSVNAGALSGGNTSDMLCAALHLSRYKLSNGQEYYNMFFRAEVFEGSAITSVTVNGPGISNLVLSPSTSQTGEFFGQPSSILVTDPSASNIAVGNAYTFSTNLTSVNALTPTVFKIHSVPQVTPNMTVDLAAGKINWNNISDPMASPNFPNVVELDVEIRTFSTSGPGTTVFESDDLPFGQTSIDIPSSLASGSYIAVVRYRDVFGTESRAEVQFTK